MFYDIFRQFLCAKFLVRKFACAKKFTFRRSGVQKLKLWQDIPRNNKFFIPNYFLNMCVMIHTPMYRAGQSNGSWLLLNSSQMGGMMGSFCPPNECAHWGSHTAHCTLHTAHCTLHTAHCTLHTGGVTLHTGGVRSVRMAPPPAHSHTLYWQKNTPH